MQPILRSTSARHKGLYLRWPSAPTPARFFLGDREWARTSANNGKAACPIRCCPVIKDTATAAKVQRSSDYRTDLRRPARDLLLSESEESSGKEHRNRNRWKPADGRLGSVVQLRSAAARHDRRRIRTDIGKTPSPRRSTTLCPGRRSTMWTHLLCRTSFRESLIAKANSASGSAKQRLSCSTTSVFRLKTWSDDHRTLYWSNGHPKHHTNEDDGQLGCVLNCMWNRDPMAHAHVNFTRSGLPIKEMKHIAKVT